MLHEHVGFNVLRKLYSEGHRIKVMVRSKTELFEGFEIEMVKGDITDKKSLKGFCNHLDAVIHLTALVSV